MIQHKLSIILLAAGASRRMGSNKLLLPFQEGTILDATLDQLEKSGLGEIFIVVGYEADRVQPLLEGCSCKVVFNPRYENGMTGSIQAGIAQAPAGSAGFMICLADMPLITAVEYRFLAEAFFRLKERDPEAIVQPQFQARRGNPVIFSGAYRDELLALHFPDGAKLVVQANFSHVHLLDMPTDAVLLDADTPAAYKQLLKRINEDSI